RFSRVVASASYGFFFSSRRRHTRSKRDWSSDVCSSDLLFEFVVRFLQSAPGCFNAQALHEPCRGCTSVLQEHARKVTRTHTGLRSEERRVGKSVDLGGRRNRKNTNTENTFRTGESSVNG